MVRDNVKCLSRRTRCTSKREDRLQRRLDIYVSAHNAMINLKHQGRATQPCAAGCKIRSGFSRATTCSKNPYLLH